jgi:4-amino-4-deoxy-L-arabinose transferase-like glycosyltransferase
MPVRKKTQFIAAAALLSGLLLRLVFLSFHPLWVGDTLIYGDLAENMLRHHVFGFSQTLQPTLIRLPGYPLFLAACFLLFGHSNYLAVVLIQIALDLFGCALLGLLAARLFHPRAGLITLWLAALCPFTANYTAAALTETVSIFCVSAALFALERFATTYRRPQTHSSTPPQNCHFDRSLAASSRGAAEKPAVGTATTPGLSSQAKVGPLISPQRTGSSPAHSSLLTSHSLWSLLIGLACAFAVLVRPDQGLLAAAVIPAMLWLTFRTPNRTLFQRIAPSLTASLIVVLPLLIWGVRNYRVFHVIQPLAPRYANDPDETVDLSFQRWFRTWGIDFKSTYDVYWNYDGAPIALASVPPRAFDTPVQRAETVALLNRYNASQSETPAFDAAFEHLAEQRIAAHPFNYYITMPVARLADMWLRPRTELLALPMDWWNFPPHPGASTFALIYALLDAAYLIAALIGLLRWFRALARSQLTILLAIATFFLLRTALLLTLDNSEPRYVLECFPIVFLFAAASFLSSPHGDAASSNSLQTGD